MPKIDENEILRRLKLLSQIQPGPQATERAINRARLGFTLGKVTRRYKIKRPIFRFAAAAVLLICAGFFAGWLFAPEPIDVEQLRTEIENTLKSSFAANCEQIKDEINRQIRRDLTEFAAQTLAASTTMTDRRLMELIQLIEAARMKDRRHIEAAIEQVELNRRQDRNGLVAFVTRSSELQDAEQN